MYHKGSRGATAKWPPPPPDPLLPQPGCWFVGFVVWAGRGGGTRLVDWRVEEWFRANNGKICVRVPPIALYPFPSQRGQYSPRATPSLEEEGATLKRPTFPSLARGWWGHPLLTHSQNLRQHLFNILLNFLIANAHDPKTPLLQIFSPGRVTFNQPVVDAAVHF
jgi:hypothetical protein